MNRRQFLKLAISALAASTIDPEELLWTPSKKTIFIPSLAQTNFINRTAADKLFFKGAVYGGSAGGGKSWIWHKTSYDLISNELGELINILEGDKRKGQ